MKWSLCILALISMSTAFAGKNDPSNKNFYHGKDMISVCNEWSDRALENSHSSSNSKRLFDSFLEMCVTNTQDMYLTKSSIMSKKILEECLNNRPNTETKSCLRSYSGVTFPAEAEIKCRGLSMEMCTKLFVNLDAKQDEKPDKGLMKDLKDAVNAGNLDKARALLDKIQGKNSRDIACEGELPGMQINDSRVQKFIDDGSSVTEKGKNNSSR